MLCFYLYLDKKEQEQSSEEEQEEEEDEEEPHFVINRADSWHFYFNDFTFCFDR